MPTLRTFPAHNLGDLSPGQIVNDKTNSASLGKIEPDDGGRIDWIGVVGVEGDADGEEERNNREEDLPLQ